MFKVSFQPHNLSVQVESGTTILEAARLGGVKIQAPCNGTGTCGKCKVLIDEKEVVLACQTKVEKDILVQVLDNSQQENWQILRSGKSFPVQLNSFISKAFKQEENITEVYAGEKLLSVEKGDTQKKNYGVVVDLGTTTLVISLLNLYSGEELASVSSLNPQSIYAQDVLSRIKFASEEAGLQTLHLKLIKELNRMIHQLSQRAGVNKRNIYEVVLSGNTCMLYLALGTNPAALGKYPYNPEITGGEYYSAAEVGLEISAYGLIYLPPIISAYLGADITCGILAAQLHRQKGITLFIDIGTNGELVLAMDGKLSAASTAAGPAFEGMNIEYGMGAGAGAIEFFNIEENGSITIKTINDTQAQGICGSGLVDIVGELIAHGVIDRSGRLLDSDNLIGPMQERLLKKEDKLAFKLSEEVFLSQKDIRQLQLAKGAIRAGIESLLKNKNIEASKVDKVLIAGAFGYHLRTKSLINIGLLPKELAGKIHFIGNTSKAGGQAFLLNQNYKKQMEELVKEVEVLELANEQDFNKIFIDCLDF